MEFPRRDLRGFISVVWVGFTGFSFVKLNFDFFSTIKRDFHFKIKGGFLLIFFGSGTKNQKPGRRRKREKENCSQK